MPNNDDKSMDILSIDEINELFEDVIEVPDDYRFLAGIRSCGTTSPSSHETNLGGRNAC